MKKILATLLFALTILPLGAKEKEQTLNVLPYPQKVEFTKGSFRVSGASFNCDAAIDDQTRKLVHSFASHLGVVTGRTSTFAVPHKVAEAAASGNVKGFVFVKDASMEEEAYSINVQPKYVVVKAASRPGFFYAIQTLKQLLPAAVYGDTPLEKGWSLPCMLIEDKPAFAYRGMHLDVSRHFFSVDEVKRYIDILAVYKMNRLHWHLTDDQGWRVEIKKYPRLTEVGAFRNGTVIKKDWKSNDGIRHGGFYTQEQIAEIVKYAEERCITIIPEIDLPGHMLAALASYPELGCTGGPYEVWMRWGVSKQVLNPANPKTMQFLKDVLAEIAEMFPSEYIHIGGDECPKDEWKENKECQELIAKLGLKTDSKATAEQRLQNWVTKEMQDFLATKGKKIIGWDEILEGDLSEGATVMSWRGTKGGIEAANRGFDVIMTPTTYCYFDFAQSRDLESEPFSITGNPNGALPYAKTYSFDPYKDITPEAKKHILGVQANVWTEYIATNDHLEYMILPRLGFLCEIQWSNPETRDYDRVANSVRNHHFDMYKALGMNYRDRLDF